MADSFVPLDRMRARAEVAKSESDTAYFLELMYMGELVVKLIAIELLAALKDDREHHRYGLEYRLVRADGIGEWAQVIDDVLNGPASQHLSKEGAVSQRALTSQSPVSEYNWQRRAVLSLDDAYRQVDSNFEDRSRTRIAARLWIRQFAALRNRTRGHGASKPSILSDICEPLRLSIDEMIDNLPVFNRPWSYLKRNLSGKYRVSSFGGDRTGFGTLSTDASHSLPEGDGVYVMLDKPRKARLLFSDPDLNDFLLPNGNYRKGKFELLSYITDETQEESGSQWVLPAEARPASETSSKPDLDIVSNVLSNMPTKIGGYVTRIELEDDLFRVLNDDRHPVVTLHGRGGVGKTSLALEVLHKIATIGTFYGIVWFSARDIDLLPDGPKVVRADVLTKVDIAKDFWKLMRPEGSGKLAESEQFLTDCLSGQDKDGPYIFVFDNFETIREQGDLYTYLSNAVRLPNKVLITTRSREFKADYPVSVGGLTQREHKTLVDELAVKFGIGNLVDREYETLLFEESDGHPYITKVLLGEVVRLGHRVTPERVIATKDSLLDALFERSYATLAPASQRVFLTLCSWRSLVPRLGLEAVILRPGNDSLDIDHAVMELSQSSLIEELIDDSTSSGFLSVPLAAALFGRRKIVTSPLKFAIEADLELIREFGAMTTTEMTQGLGARVDRLTRTIAKRAESKTDLTKEISVLQYIASEYSPAWLNLSELHQERGNTLEAISAMRLYLESIPGDADVWRRLIALYRSANDPLGEMDARLQLAALLPTFDELSAAARRFNYLVAQRDIDLDSQERVLMARSFRDLLESRSAEASADDLSALAWLCLHCKDPEAASIWVKAGLQLDPDNTHCKGLEARLTSNDGH
ncbi:hypothetical protein D1871_16590 [Nakamurella silvestris]|nr:hypothetical protein D1871_16590 [Nakamurella silvestris]